MAKTKFTVEMDAEVKKQLDALCEEVGMSTSTAINMFAKAFVKERMISNKSMPAGRLSGNQATSNKQREG